MRKWLLGIGIILYALCGALAWAQPQIPPRPTSQIYVQDYANVLQPETKQRLQSLGSKLAARTKAQVVVVTVPSLNGAAPEEYGLALLREWGIGDQKLNNGVLLLVAVSDRSSRIEVGYGLEGALPDSKTGRLQDEYMLPYFKQGEYDAGIWNGYLALTQEVAREYQVDLGEPSKPKAIKPAPPDNNWYDALPWWARWALAAGVAGLLLFDWLVLGGAITWALLSIVSSGRRGGGGGSGYGGGSGGGGGSSRNW